MTREERVLRYVNRLREERKIGPALDALPKGDFEDSRTCPLAIALTSDVDDDGVAVYGDQIFIGDSSITPPLYVEQFVAAFDAGRYPHLEAAA